MPFLVMPFVLFVFFVANNKNENPNNWCLRVRGHESL